jgi:hypothetical protein
MVTLFPALRKRRVSGRPGAFGLAAARAPFFGHSRRRSSSTYPTRLTFDASQIGEPVVREMRL